MVTLMYTFFFLLVFKGVVLDFLLKGGDEGRYFLLSRHLGVMFSCCCYWFLPYRVYFLFYAASFRLAEH